MTRRAAEEEVAFDDLGGTAGVVRSEVGLARQGLSERSRDAGSFADDSVVSEVHGSDDFYTKLAVDGKGELQGVCTCPVGRRCKHTVALALVAAKLLKGRGKRSTLIPDFFGINDPRFSISLEKYWRKMIFAYQKEKERLFSGFRHNGVCQHPEAVSPCPKT